MADKDLTYKELVIALSDALRKSNLPHMFVGGLAVNFYGMIRATYDIDIVLWLEEKDVNKFVINLKELGFNFDKEDVRTILKAGNRFMDIPKASSFRVDFWLPKTDFEKLAFKRRTQKNIFGRRVWIVSGEDLILFKLLAERGKDKDDIIGILLRQKDKLDWTYLDHWAGVLNREKELKTLQKEAK